MSRAMIAMLSVAGLAFGLIQGGCVSRAEYDRLRSMNATCEGQRAELRNQLAEATGQLKALQDERDRFGADKDARIAALVAQIQKADQLLAAAQADNQKLRDELVRLGQERQTVVNINGPRLDKEVDAALKKFVEDHPGLIEYDAENGLVRFSSDLLFDSGSYTVKADMVKQLAAFADVINIPEAQKYDILVVGHTDTVKVSRPETKAKTPTNWHLSVYRAVSVVEALRDAKVASGRLGAMGFGEQRLRVNKQGAVKENRRVEIYLVPKGALLSVTSGPVVLGEDLARLTD